MILLALIGLAIFMYPFDYYNQLSEKHVDTTSLLIVICTKGIGVLFMYIATIIHKKHFKNESMNKTMTYSINTMSADIHKEFSSSLERFGTYTCDDKGVDQVMNLQPWVEKIKDLDKSSAAELFSKIINHKNKRSQTLAEALFTNCDDMPKEWFEYVLSNSNLQL